MTINVSPDNPASTHHIGLSDGTHSVGLILCNASGALDPRAFARDPIPNSALKIYEGEQEYSDLQPPWSDVPQTDWAGGYGGKVFEEDRSRYWTGHRMDTTRNGRCIRGPMEQYATGLYSWVGNWNTSACVGMYGLYNGYNQNLLVGLASRFLGNGTTPTEIWLYIRQVGNPGPLSMAVMSDVAGLPGEILGGGEQFMANVRYQTGGMYIKTTSNFPALAAGTPYFLAVWGYWSDNEANHWEIAYTTSEEDAPAKVDDGGDGYWELVAMAPLFRLTPAAKALKAHFAILKNSLWVGAEYLDNSNPALYINGTAGVATGGDANGVIDTNNAVLTDDAHNGDILYLWNGKGSNAVRRVSDTVGASKKLVVPSALEVAPDTTTEYAVMSPHKFTQAGTFATPGLTDLLSTHGALYVARGDGQVMGRVRWFYSGGGYYQYTNETGQFTLLDAVSNGADTVIWGAKRTTLPATVSSAAALDCTGVATVAALTFGAAVNVGDLSTKITGLTSYGEESADPYVFKEDGIYKILNDTPYGLRIAALANARDGWNGIAQAVNDVYLYFNFLGRVQRYYRGQLDDMGPDGLTGDRAGRVAALCAYPGRIYAAVDAGADGYSSIHVHNGQGWCEVYRAPAVGKRIMSLFIQPIPGAQNADLLWFSCGADVVSMPIVIDAYDCIGVPASQNYNGYRWAPSSSIETGWIYHNMRGIYKLFAALAVSLEQQNGDHVHVAYKVDGATSWTPIGSLTDGSGELPLGTNYNVTGRRIKFLIEITGAADTSGVLDAVVVEMLATVPYKYVTNLTFRVSDNDEDLLYNPDEYTDADAKIAQLKAWAAQPGALLMSAHVDELHNKYIKLDVGSLRLLNHTIEEIDGRKRNLWIYQATAYEL